MGGLYDGRPTEMESGKVFGAKRRNILHGGLRDEGAVEGRPLGFLLIYTKEVREGTPPT